MNTLEDISFIITSGPPDKGKWERISHARSILTKRQFQRIKKGIPSSNLPHSAKQRYSDKLSKPINPKGQSLSKAADDSKRNCGHPFEYAELPLLTPVNLSLDSAILSTFTSRRVYEFLETHLHCQSRSPFLQNIIPWSILNPHLMSAKLLNASGWDDIQRCGELSPSTLQQWSITNRILQGCLTNGNEAYTDATISAIQSMLGFELLRGNVLYFDKLRGFAEKMVATKTNHMQINDGGFLLSCFSLLDQAHQLRLAPVWSMRSTTPRHINFQSYLLFPGNPSVFSYVEGLASMAISQLDQRIHNTLTDLYYLVSFAASMKCYTLEHHDTVISAWANDTKYISLDLERPDFRVLETVSQASLVLEIVTFLVACQMSSAYQFASGLRITQAITKLRRLLDLKTETFESDSNWKLIPGALVWCHAIGLRFASLGPDKTWFLMRMLSVAHVWMIDVPETATKSLQMVTDGLINI